MSLVTIRLNLGVVLEVFLALLFRYIRDKTDIFAIVDVISSIKRLRTILGRF